MWNQTRSDDVGVSVGVGGLSVMATTMKICTITRSTITRVLRRPTRSESHHTDTETRSATRPVPNIGHHIDAVTSHVKTITMEKSRPSEKAKPAKI